MSAKLLPIGLALAAFLYAQVPSDAEIRKILAQRVDEYRQSVGIVVGVIDANGRRLVSYGALEKNDTRPLNGDTVFEIGSITKAFTGLLLADMAQHGEVAITDPIAKYLPAEVKVPQRGGKQIRLEDLATHMSGLPRLPSNFQPKDAGNPYVDYTVDQLYQFLSSYELPRDVDSQFEYSNLGFGLLGHVLARRAGVGYEALVASRIAKPLEINSTAIALTPEMKSRMAVGHNEKLESVPNWDLPTLAGAGALRSTANDLLKFLSAAMGYTETPLAPAFAAMLSVRRPAGPMESTLGWQIFSPGGNDLIWKDGGTGGFGSFIGYDAKARAGVVVLSNSFTLSGAFTGVNDIGLHLLNAAFPLNRPPKQHTEISVDPKIFDRYTGIYRANPKMAIAITRDGTHLYGQATGDILFELFPETEKDYFAKIAGIEMTFQTDQQDKASAMVFRQGGTALTIRRADGEAPPVPKEHKEIVVDPKLFDGYVGRYQFAPTVTLTVTREGSALFAQVTGQEKFQIFPEGEKEYFWKVVDAQVTFETDAQGRATAVVLHQGGIDQQAKRIE